jgi:hypothetical protein
MKVRACAVDQLVYVHQAHGGVVDRRAQQNTVFATLVSLTKRFEASLSTICTDSLCLRIAEVPRCRDLAIFVRTTDDRRQTTDTQTDCFTPAAHARTRGNKP